MFWSGGVGFEIKIEFHGTFLLDTYRIHLSVPPNRFLLQTEEDDDIVLSQHLNCLEFLNRKFYV
jgi:hypothetical protein